MTEVHILRVFTDESDSLGNPLAVVLDPTGLPEEARQQLATQLNLSETVFVEKVDKALLRIFTPAREIPLAGHPLVGTSWLLSRLAGKQIDVLRPLRAGNVDTWAEDGVTWIRTKVEDAPDWQFVELETPEAVEELKVPPAPEYDLHEFWAWQDKDKGLVRARVFAGSHNIAEDEATGSGALRLVAQLERPLVIKQGHGSLIYARPAEGGRAAIGGRVVSDGVRKVET